MSSNRPPDVAFGNQNALVQSSRYGNVPARVGGVIGQRSLSRHPNMANVRGVTDVVDLAPIISGMFVSVPERTGDTGEIVECGPKYQKGERDAPDAWTTTAPYRFVRRVPP